MLEGLFKCILCFCCLWLYCQAFLPLDFIYRRDGWDMDIFRNVESLIAHKGYPVEIHTAQTPDGYLLTLHRISRGRGQQLSFIRRPAVVVFHGVLGSSADFVLNYPHNSLGFQLADAGYDVWLCNFRGNSYSKKHVEYSTYQSKFWNFNIDDFAFRDIPTLVDYVIGQTNQRRIFSVAFSLGNGAMFALLSTKPSFSDKLIVHAALAPSFQLNHLSSPIFSFTPLTKPFLKMSDILGARGSLVGVRPFFDLLSRHFCQLKFSSGICPSLINSVDGIISSHLNKSRIPVYLSHFPSGSSVYVIMQMWQTMKAKKYQMFDYGLAENLVKYNSTNPPSYDLHRVRVPIGLYWSQSDTVSEPRDIDYLRRHLPTIARDYRVPTNNFTHLSFVYGYDAGVLLYKDVIDFLNMYRSPISS